jgi:hypothetical protein
MSLDPDKFSFEDLAHALYVKGKALGFAKVTDKTKWRELVMAEKLGHRAFPRISSGRHTVNYGADADNLESGLKAEYKSQALEDVNLRNLLQLTRGSQALKYSALVATGVYNGAYTLEAVQSYRDKEHYFGLFYEELCVLILKIHNNEVEQQLTEGLSRQQQSTQKKTTNLNSVRVRVSNTDQGTDQYQVVYKNQTWFQSQQGQ